MRRSLGMLLCGALVLLVAAPSTAQQSSEPSGEAVAQARAHFQRAEKLYNDRAFEAALVELLKAYELAPSYRLLYNIGLAHLEIGDYAAAIQVFQRYLDEGGVHVPKARRQEVMKKMRALRDRVASVRIEVSEDGAEILVDDIPVGRSPLADPVLVNAGRRRVAAVLQGRPQVRQVLVVAGGDSATVTLKFEEKGVVPPSPAAPEQPQPVTQTPKPAAAPSPKPAPPQAEKSDSTMAWIGWTATGLLAAGAVTTGILTMSASSDLDDERNSYAADPAAKRDSLDSTADRVQTMALVTDILAGAAVVVGGVTLYATLASDEPKPSPSLEVGLAPGSLVLSGQFH